MTEQDTRDERLTSDERALARSVAEAFSTLPHNKREFILGYAEGVIAMSGRTAPRQDGA